MTQQTIIAQFDSRSDAQQAVEALTEAGISRSAIRLVPETETSGYQRTDQRLSYDRTSDEGGFWSSLSDFFLPEEDRYSYAEGMSRGGTTLSVTVEEAQAERAADIVERYGAVDMDERESTWRSEGWTGYTAGATGSGTASMQTDASAATGVTADTRASTGDTEVIPIAEEQLRVGKRQVNQGRVRIRSYVVETPVSEQVSLREERVHVERRPADRALTGNENLFQERTIEAEERAEEAVVSKEARVKEELVIRKDVEERTETVSDTVRRTEVDVDDERGVSETRTSTTGSSNDRGRA
ncbi:YsnF/AvaK domain-containing protein [Microvirga mediterraneensis]|uniref:YsnF/AvaK domain-containing protein n=1 Tax=Microvirga mediterraneensis TaxID=2754695 RepID=A0A838BV52_9HYPH|nr:YsnF/AvaK domain-containing protein [Microvirga mediterraneensis]MBA1159130.1 YsnF/AvaK domain-containing protein [Microvirga mediterraneensis]